MTNKPEENETKITPPVTEEKNTTPPSTPQQSGEKDALTARLDQIENGLKADLEESREETRQLREELKKSNRQNNSNDDDVVDTQRKSAHIMEFPVIEGAPVIKSKVTGVLGIKGVEMIASVETADGKKYDLPFGCDIKQVDFSTKATENLHRVPYESLRKEKFELIDIDPNDLTGASKVEKGVVVSDGALIPEIDRSSGTPVATGRKIRTKVTKDIRHYTIMFDGKKFTLTNEDLANIRI